MNPVTFEAIKIGLLFGLIVSSFFISWDLRLILRELRKSK